MPKPDTLTAQRDIYSMVQPREEKSVGIIIDCISRGFMKVS